MTNRRQGLLRAILATALAAHPALGGDATLSGRVTDASGTPMPGANLILTGSVSGSSDGNCRQGGRRVQLRRRQPRALPARGESRRLPHCFHRRHRTRIGRLQAARYRTSKRRRSTSSRVSYLPPGGRKRLSTPPLRSQWSRDPRSGTSLPSTFRSTCATCPASTSQRVGSSRATR